MDEHQVHMLYLQSLEGDLDNEDRMNEEREREDEVAKYWQQLREERLQRERRRRLQLKMDAGLELTLAEKIELKGKAKILEEHMMEEEINLATTANDLYIADNEQEDMEEQFALRESAGPRPIFVDGADEYGADEFEEEVYY